MGKRKAPNLCSNNDVTENIQTDDDILEPDDDELPIAFPSTQNNEEFKKGDLLFAQFPRYPYWPALFFSYMTKKKHRRQRAYVFFFDNLSKIIDSRKTKKTIIPVHVDKIKRFSCSERNELIKNGSGHKDFLDGMEQAEEYMRKRALGKISNFFEYVVEETSLSDDEEESQDIEEKPEQISEEELVVKNAKKACKSLFQSSNQNTEMATKIIIWIQNNSRPILNDITNGKINSQRHHIFHNGTQKDKDKLRWYSGFGELNETSADEILNLLVSWFIEDFPSSKYKALSYVADVWLPEAYIHALSQTKNLLLKDAEMEYLK